MGEEPARPDGTRALRLTTAIAGIAAPVLLFGAQGLIQVGGVEPPFDASAAEIQAFFETRDPQLAPAGTYLAVLGVIVFVWFLGGLYTLLREKEPHPPWRSAVALLSGVVFITAVFATGWGLAIFRVDQGLDPEVAQLVFDMGNLGFASSWVALGSFSLAAGWAILSSVWLPRWMGWWALAVGAGLVLSRAVWTTSFWIFPYLLFWVWVITLSVMLLAWKSLREG